jgi:hypothetical protein
MTPEELDKARAKEAWRVWEGVKPSLCEDNDVALFAARLAREGWTPPPPVDPDLLAVREIVAAEWGSRLCREDARKTLSGANDLYVEVKAAFAAYKAGKAAR